MALRGRARAVACLARSLPALLEGLQDRRSVSVGRVARKDLRARVDVVCGAVRGADDHRDAAGQRLGHRAAEVLVLAGLDEQSGLPEQRWDLLSGDPGPILQLLPAREAID